MKLDKFYTKKEISKKVINTLKEKIDINKYDIILEPSAGNGSFSNILMEEYSNVIALDILPENDKIIKMDYFKYNPENKTYLVIGNPPFGRVSSLAYLFMKKSCEFADVICFILPRTFKRVSFLNKIDLNYHLIYQEDIPQKSFIPESMMAKCCFQIWERRKEKREKIILKETTEDFKILKIKDRFNADFAVRAYGGNCGTISYEIKNLAPKSWHFIKAEKDVDYIIKKIKKIDFSFSKDTARQDSVGAKEFVHYYNKT